MVSVCARRGSTIKMTEPSQPDEVEDEKSASSASVGDPAELVRSSAVVGVATLLSRVLGLLRDVVLANLIGASSNADAFFVAFKIPNFLRRLFAEGAFAQAFVPVLAQTREQGGNTAVRELIDRVAGMLGGILTGLTVLTVMASPLVAVLFAPGFLRDPAKLALTGDLIKLTFPYLLLISLTGFAGAILNSYQRFAVPALTPILLNLSLIAAALWVAPGFDEPVVALALGVLIAGFAQLLFQLPALAAIDLVPRPRWEPGHAGVRRILILMVPALFGVSVSQINLLLDTVLASLLPAGSVSWLYYSDRLTELPLGIFAIAIATVILPALSGQRARADDPAFRRHAVLGGTQCWLYCYPSNAGAGDPGRAIISDAVSIRRFWCRRSIHGSGKFASVYPRLGRVYVGQSVSARILCPRRYENTGSNWGHRNGHQYGAQYAICFSSDVVV